MTWNVTVIAPDVDYARRSADASLLHLPPEFEQDLKVAVGQLYSTLAKKYKVSVIVSEERLRSFGNWSNDRMPPTDTHPKGEPPGNEADEPA